MKVDLTSAAAMSSFQAGTCHVLVAVFSGASVTACGSSAACDSSAACVALLPSDIVFILGLYACWMLLYFDMHLNANVLIPQQ